MSQENKSPKFNIQNDKGDSPRKGPKFNLYWIYGIIAVVLITSNLWSFSPDISNTNELEFKQEMLAKGDVQKLELISNKNTVRVFISKDSLSKAFYTQKFSKKPLDKSKFEV